MNPRLGKCYELSYQFATSHPEYFLIHGYITSPDRSKVIDHAWVETDDIVFDPVMDQEFPQEVYYQLYSAEPFKKYSFKETISFGAKTGVYGPWHDHPNGKVKFPGYKDDVIKRTRESIEQFLSKPRLKESLSSIVYHTTWASNFLGILTTNTFNLTSSLGTEADNVGKYHYYMSFSSVKFGGYSRAKENPGQVTLVLNGTKFNQRYKGVPVDYWGPTFRQGSMDQHLKHDENEERLWTNSSNIPNATSYIIEAHILFGTKGKGWNWDDPELCEGSNSAIRKILDYSRAKGIKVFLYDSLSSYRNQNKAKAFIKLDKDISYIDAVLELAKHKDIKSLPNKFPYDRLKTAMVYKGIDLDSFLTGLSSDVHNYRTKPEFQDQIQDLTKLVIKTKTKTLKGLLDYLCKECSRNQ